MSQTSVSVNPPIARAGLIADGSVKNVDSYVSEGALAMGLLLQRGSSDDQIKAMAALPSADDDSIIETAVNTALTAQDFEGATLDGVIGLEAIIPAQQITMALNDNADWLDSFAYVTGLTPFGWQTEAVAIPVGGNTTITTVNAFLSVSKISIDAQDGVEGEMTVGTNPANVVITQKQFPGIAIYEHMQVPYDSDTEYGDNEQISVMSKGRVWVESEGAVSAGDDAYVRVVEVGADLRGQLSAQASANHAPLHGCKFVTSTTSAGFVQLELAG